MIKLEHVVLASPEQMEFIIEGCRNPLNSWARSDSTDCNKPCIDCHLCPDTGDKDKDADLIVGCYEKYHNKGFILGPNDHDLMQRLANAGTDHRKFMRMMPVYVRITAPLYWWKQFDTFKVGTVANSCSTMHKIHEKEFTWDDFSYEHLFRVRDCKLGEFVPTLVLEKTINALNYWRERYLAALKTEDETGLPAKDIWWQMIQLLPSSYNQTRNVMMNYEVLANIYKSRKNHKLDEWRVHETPEEYKFINKDFSSGMWGFCDWIESLPYSELIVGEKED